jgi:hypothetical protein
MRREHMRRTYDDANDGSGVLSALALSFAVLAVVVGGALLGALLRSLLPEHHISDESKDVVKTGIGLLATMSAFVLGLLIASTKSAFDIKAGEVKEMVAKVVLLDRGVRQYGPETRPIRELIQRAMVSMVNLSWLESESQANSRLPTEGAPTAGSIEDVQQMLRALSPTNDTQRAVQSRTLQLSNDLAQTRWLLFAQRGSAIPIPFLAVLVWWLAVIFGTLGLFAPRNKTVYSIIFVFALSVSSAIYLILALDQPFEGLLRISDGPLRIAISQLSQ